VTREEFETNYKDVTVKFSGYYKYSFSFVKELSDGIKITAYYGGDAGDIYRFDVTADEEVPLFPLDNWSSVYVTKNGEKLLSIDNSGW
jgi:hypothetical protein